MKYLIAGLGNIGEEYANTRHNIGFVTVDAFAKASEASFLSDKYVSIARTSHKGRKVILIKPTTYVNLSGKAITYWLAKEKIPLENLLVIVDDIALPLGALRMKTKGSDGGHNGLIDIIAQMGTTEFPRLRIGIGDDFAKGYQVEYVLGKWTKKEEEILIPRIEVAVEAIKSFVHDGIERAMNRYNTRINNGDTG
ncbi:MAG: aminoacyl-tRNA hydrolase [Bacteroidetes bacterium]|nr:aminoacyl-tRNA hydrolase [Bacteroidota bacterium]